MVKQDISQLGLSQQFLGSDPKFTQEGFKGGVGGGEHGEGAFGLQGFNQLSLGKGGDKDAEIGI